MYVFNRVCCYLTKIIRTSPRLPSALSSPSSICSVYISLERERYSLINSARNYSRCKRQGWMVESRRKGAHVALAFHLDDGLGRCDALLQIARLLGRGFHFPRGTPERLGERRATNRKFHETAEIRQQLTCAPWRGGPISFYREQVSLARYCYRREYISATDATWMPSQTRRQTWKFVVKKNPPFSKSFLSYKIRPFQD